jgi:hypothetical protein
MNGLCIVCQPGFWGNKCQFLCKSDKCLQCNKETGYCSICPSGRWGLLCQHMCRDECPCCSISTGACSYSCPAISGIFTHKKLY